MEKNITDNKMEITGKFGKFLKFVERIGNALPHPGVLFLILTFVVLILSMIVSSMGLEAIHPIKKEIIKTVNLFSKEGLHLVLLDMVKNFSHFAPLGTVLVAMLGFSIAEKSGLLGTVLRLIVVKSPKALVIPMVFLAGILSHTAGDVGYVLLVPLAAMVFHSMGMNPLAGIAACFAGVSGGFAANFLLSTADPLLSGISQEAARIIDPNYVVLPVSNWYFMASSSILIIILGTIIANKITIPYFGEYKGPEKAIPLEPLTLDQKRGLKAAGLVLLSIIGILLWGLIPEEGFLRDPETKSIIASPVVKGVVVVIFFLGSLTGIAYGYVSKKFKNHNDVISAMQDGMSTLAPYLVLVFFASQFISIFNASNVGMILAIHGSEFLKGLGASAAPLMIGFILLTVFMDLIIGSASAKWALMAPIFVPMFMLLGLAPELSQASYRIADSVVNIISPLMSYFPLILAFIIKYEPRARVGTIIAMMLPYSICFLLFWSLMLFVWLWLELPLGPGSNLFYVLPQ